jgi:hypothetical protein
MKSDLLPRPVQLYALADHLASDALMDLCIAAKTTDLYPLTAHPKTNRLSQGLEANIAMVSDRRVNLSHSSGPKPDPMGESECPYLHTPS